jgi:chemotaxis methyl-accepting protein methylase
MNEKSRHIAKLVFQSGGIDINKYDESFLGKSIQKRVVETHCETLEKYFSFLEQHEDERLCLIDSLQISYSEFFRNSLTFAVIERIIIPALIHRKDNKETRIWSVACAMGQEAYSLAMLLEEYSDNYKNKINYRIFATDQSESQINDAKKGLFYADSLRRLSLKMAEQWFLKQGDNYIVKQELQKNIDFSVFDLFNEKLICPPSSIFGDFDLVFCANLLFYYKDEYRYHILEKIRKSMAVGGYIITGETERDILTSYNYIEVFPKSAIFRI